MLVEEIEVFGSNILSLWIGACDGKGERERQFQPRGGEEEGEGEAIVIHGGSGVFNVRTYMGIVRDICDVNWLIL